MKKWLIIALTFSACTAVVYDPVAIPSIRTLSAVIQPDSVSAVIKARIDYDGGNPLDILERGFYWNRFGNPDSSDNHIPAGSGIGLFEATLDSLVSGETYFIKSYMIVNEEGLKYGNELFLNVPE